jgi:hypothetical protein
MKAKIFLFVIMCMFLGSCDVFRCDCDYVKYERNPQTNYVWKETYRSSWDSSCSNEDLRESIYTDTQGRKWYTKTKIVCK